MILVNTLRKKAALLLIGVLTVGAVAVTSEAPASASTRYVSKGSTTLHHRNYANTRQIVVHTWAVHDMKKDLWRAQVKIRCYWRTKVLEDWTRASCTFNEIGLLLHTKSVSGTEHELEHLHWGKIDDSDGVVSRHTKWRKIANNLQVQATTHADVVKIVGQSFCWQDGQCMTNGKWVSAK